MQNCFLAWTDMTDNQTYRSIQPPIFGPDSNSERWQRMGAFIYDLKHMVPIAVNSQNLPAD
jgi:hypothetical protein